jgi:hypothetical protein
MYCDFIFHSLIFIKLQYIVILFLKTLIPFNKMSLMNKGKVHFARVDPHNTVSESEENKTEEVEEKTTDPVYKYLRFRFPSVKLFKFAVFETSTVYGCIFPKEGFTQLYIFGFTLLHVDNPVELSLIDHEWQSLHFRDYSAYDLEKLHAASPLRHARWKTLENKPLQVRVDKETADEDDALVTYSKDGEHHKDYLISSEDNNHQYVISLESKFKEKKNDLPRGGNKVYLSVLIEHHNTFITKL